MLAAVAATTLVLLLGCGDSDGDGSAEGAGTGGAGGAGGSPLTGGAGGAGGVGDAGDRDAAVVDESDAGLVPMRDAGGADAGDAIDPTACLAADCQNGSTCVAAAGGVGCDCWPGYSGAHCELPAVAPASQIACPASGRPADGWPLVFTFNGNCFRSVDASGLAAEAADALVDSGTACAATIAHADIDDAADLDALIRAQIVPRIENNRGLVNTQKIGAIGFSAGGTLAAYLGTVWALGIDPADASDHAFRVGAVIDFYGPLRLDRTHATDGSGALTGGGGLLYLHETRAAGVNVDIPGVRQWSATNCFCAARGTNPCNCQDASEAYLAAYQPGAGICAFDLDDVSLTGMSATAYVAANEPAHVAALYFCSGWKDSNVDHDMNLHQAESFWRTEHLVTVTADDGHGFPLSVCEASATSAGSPQPLDWLIEKLSTFGAFAPQLP